MITLPAPISDAERAVNAYKHELLVRVMGHIVRRALVQPYISPHDVPEDIVEKEHRQGVASNAWNALRSLEIIEPVSLGFSDPARHIHGGRIQNKNEGAKGRWVSAYKLKSRAAALTWCQRNNIQLSPREVINAAQFEQPIQLSIL